MILDLLKALAKVEEGGLRLQFLEGIVHYHQILAVGL